MCRPAEEVVLLNSRLPLMEVDLRGLAPSPAPSSAADELSSVLPEDEVGDEPKASPSKWGLAKASQKQAQAAAAITGQGNEPEKRRGLIARAFGGEQDLFGLAAMGGKKARKLDEKELDPGRFSRSLLADHVEGMPLPGMLIAVLTLFDVDGTNNLSEQEWLDGNEALELSTSKSEFQRLRRATPGNDSSTNSEELNFAKTMGIYGSRKPVEGYLEDVLRRLMKAIISLTGRVKRIQEVLDRTVLLEEITRKNRVAKVLRQWAHAHTSRAFDGWRDLTKESVALRKRVAGHWRNGLASSAWRRWVEMVDDARGQREAAARVLGRWRNRAVSGCFEVWREEVRAIVDDRNAKLGRALGMIRNRGLVLVFDAWSGLVAAQKDVKERGRRAMMRMANRLLATCFFAWQECSARDAASRKRLLQRCAARMGKRVAVKCFEAWRETAEESRSGRDEAYRRALARFVNRLAADSIETWCRFVAWRKRIFARAAHAIGPGRELYVAWRTWVAHAIESKAEEQREWFLSMVGGSLNQLVTDAVRDVLPAVMSAGSVGQLAEDVKLLKERIFGAEERAEKERLRQIGRVVRSMRHAHTSRAFDAWKEVYAETRASRQRAMRYWRNALAASVWRRWVEMVDDARGQREAAARVLGRWRNRAVSGCFEHWAHLVREASAVKQAALARAIGRMRNRALVLAFDAWAELLSRRRRAKGMQRKALVRITYGLVSEVFWAWAGDVFREANRRRQLLARVAGRMRSRLASMAFDAWRQAAQSRASGREQQYANAIARLRNRLAVFAFDVWRQFVAWRKRILHKAGYILGPGRSMYLAWRTWVSHAREAKREEERRWVLSLLTESKSWLLEALGDVLPQLLPDTSSLSSNLQSELEDLKSQTAQLAQQEAEHAASLAKQAEEAERAREDASSVAAKLHQQVDEARKLATESVAMAQAQARDGVKAVEQALESKLGEQAQHLEKTEAELAAAKAAAERSASDAADGVRESVTQLVKDSHKEGAQRLVALAKALDAQSQRVDTSAARVERELIELRTMTGDADERMRREMATMRRFIVDQTKSYLAASAGTMSDKDVLVEELARAREENATLASRVRNLEVALHAAAPASAVASLAAQLQAVSAGKAGKEEVQMLLDQVQRPAVAISRVDGGSTAVSSGGRRGGGAAAAAAGAEATADGGTGCGVGGGGGGGGSGGGGGFGASAAAVAGRTSRPRSACAATRIVPGNDFGVVGKDGAVYRGQEPPVVTTHCGEGATGGQAPTALLNAGAWQLPHQAGGGPTRTAEGGGMRGSDVDAQPLMPRQASTQPSQQQQQQQLGSVPPLSLGAEAYVGGPYSTDASGGGGGDGGDGGGGGGGDGGGGGRLGAGIRVGGPPGSRCFPSRPPAAATASPLGGGFPGSKLSARPGTQQPQQMSRGAPMRPRPQDEGLLAGIGAPGLGGTPRRAAGGSWQPQAPTQAPTRPRSAGVGGRGGGGDRGLASVSRGGAVAATLGVGYAACRDALIALEEELQERRETIEFVFDSGIGRVGALMAGAGAAASGAGASGGGERVMWLQWIAAASGAGWAFYDPGVAVSPSGEVSSPVSSAIATQRASLTDFLSQVEGRYVGFGDLVRVVHANTTLWQRPAAGTAGTAGVGSASSRACTGTGMPQPHAPTQPRVTVVDRRPHSARSSTSAAQAESTSSVAPPPAATATSMAAGELSGWEDSGGAASPIPGHVTPPPHARPPHGA